MENMLFVLIMSLKLALSREVPGLCAVRSIEFGSPQPSAAIADPSYYLSNRSRVITEMESPLQMFVN